VTDRVRDINVELMLCYSRWPDALGEQWTSGEPAVNSQTTASAAVAAGPATSTQCVTST